MTSIKGPGIFLAQFLRDEAPYNNLENIARWAASLGYKGAQIPTWDDRVFDLDAATESKSWCDGFRVKDAEFLPSGRVGVYGGY
jgi:sugar phosphate isomerase/epimerase